MSVVASGIGFHAPRGMGRRVSKLIRRKRRSKGRRIASVNTDAYSAAQERVIHQEQLVQAALLEAIKQGGELTVEDIEAIAERLGVSLDEVSSGLFDLLKGGVIRPDGLGYVVPADAK